MSTAHSQDVNEGPNPGILQTGKASPARCAHAASPTLFRRAAASVTTECRAQRTDRCPGCLILSEGTKSASMQLLFPKLINSLLVTKTELSVICESNFPFLTQVNKSKYNATYTKCITHRPISFSHMLYIFTINKLKTIIHSSSTKKSRLNTRSYITDVVYSPSKDERFHGSEFSPLL